MKRYTALYSFGLLVLCLFLFPTIGWAGQPIDWAAQPQCLPTWIAAGQRMVTPAEVVGEPREHLTLRDHNPHDIRPYEQSLLDNGYLITGDKVDLVTTCDGFNYVRFHGPQRVSTGWADKARIKVTGPARDTRPRNAAMLCKAAGNTFESGKQLDSPPTTVLDDKIIDRILPPQWQPGPNGSPTQVAHVVVDGRSLAAIVVDSGGTSHDTSVYVLSGDLRTLLSPADRDDRDVENDGADSWGFGVSEDVVIVDGHPMVHSWNRGGGSSYLSAINKDGDILPACIIKSATIKKRKIALSTDTNVCHAILAGQQAPVTMHPPAPGESLIFGKAPTQFSNYGGAIHSTTTELNYHDTEMAASVRYKLLGTGIAHLDNSNEAQSVGIVSLWEGDSSAGDGLYTNLQVLPVYLDKNGVVDLSAEANQKLAAALPHGMKDGKLVTLHGTTYVELSTDTKGRSSEVWKIDSGGVHQICGFKLTHTVVRPIPE